MIVTMVPSGRRTFSITVPSGRAIRSITTPSGRRTGVPGSPGRPGFGTVPSDAGGFDGCGRAFGSEGDVGSGGSEAGGTTDGVTGTGVRVTPDVPTASDARNSGLDAGGMGCVAGWVASGSVSGDVEYVE